MAIYYCPHCERPIRFLPGWAAGCSGCGSNYCQDCAASFEQGCPRCGGQTFDDRTFARRYEPSADHGDDDERFIATTEPQALNATLKALEPGPRRERVTALAKLEADRRLGLLDHHSVLPSVREWIYPGWWIARIAALAALLADEPEFAAQLQWRELLGGLSALGWSGPLPFDALRQALRGFYWRSDLQMLAGLLEGRPVELVVSELWPCLSGTDEAVRGCALELLEMTQSHSERPWQRGPAPLFDRPAAPNDPSPLMSVLAAGPGLRSRC